MEQYKTLLLENTYAPLKVISWQRAITLLSLGKIEVVSTYEHEVRSTSVVFKMPAVARLVRGFKRPKKPVKFSRSNIYARDGYKCAYCGVKKDMKDLTYDHVLPKSQGGKTTWTNIVTACAPCNRQKSNRTPEQAGMTLLTKPIQPDWVPAVEIVMTKKSVPEHWEDYLSWFGYKA